MCGEFFDARFSYQKYCSKKCRNKNYKDNYKLKVFKTEIKKCEFCNEDFEWSEKYPTQRFCSEKCRAKANEERAKIRKVENKNYNHKCLNCENIIIEKENTDDKFCSKECEETYKRKNTLNILNYDLEDNLKLKHNDYAKEILKEIIQLKVIEIIKKKNKNISTSEMNGKILDYWRLSNIPKEVKEYVLQRDNHECQICKNTNNLHIHHITKRADGGDHNSENLITLCGSCHRHIEIGDVELAIKGCYRNALKHYSLDKKEKHITFTEIYNDLNDACDKIHNNELNNAIYKINILLDRLDEELYNFY